MERRPLLALGAIIAVWLVGNLALGPNTGGVFLNYPPGADADGVSPTPGDQPPCVTVRVYDGRGWGRTQLIGSQIRLKACNNPAGQLRIVSGPTCTATSFLGPGTASCTATPSGNDVRVTFNVHYPFGLDWISGQPAATTFRIDPGGGYSSP